MLEIIISPLMQRNLSEQVLLKFQNEPREVPIFENEQEKKIFLQLQKYNLLYVTAEGTLRITSKGRQALKGDVEKYISLERFEQRLIKDSLTKNLEQKLILFAVVPVIILLATLLVVAQF